MPVLGQRTVPVRVRVGAGHAHRGWPRRARCRRCRRCRWTRRAFALVAQQVLIGLSLGFAVRIVFAAVEFAGELIGLQMGLNFAGFFDPATGRQGTATSRFFGTTVAFLFIVATATCW
jgi:flagellar biosynthetic protein FliR